MLVYLVLLQVSTPGSALTEYGPLGIIAAILLGAVGVLFRWVMKAYERERDRADRLEAELAKNNAAMADELRDARRRISEAAERARELRG